MFKTPKGANLYLLTTRFNVDTYSESKRWRETNNFSGSIYCSSVKIPKHVPQNAGIIIVEMNNTTNRIEGMGILINKVRNDKYIVHTDRNYNRYTYTGDIRADREWLLEQNTSLIEKLEILIFKGKDHIKRGVGFTSIPKKKLPFFETDGYGAQFQDIIHKMIAENKK
jgi:hypothetical protein